jgi:hypothetical protein
MNIVVIGGGEPGKFGNDFCIRAKREGHNVFILSHQDYSTQDPQHYYTDFSECLCRIWPVKIVNCTLQLNVQCLVE